MITRRRVLCGLAGLAFGAAQTVLAQQQTRVWRVGFLGLRSRPSSINPDVYYNAFVDQLRKLGYVEGKNLIIEGRYADGNYERLAQLAADLVRLKVDVIVTHGTPGPRAALAATTSIPVIGLAAIDPVGSGFATSLSRPGKNFTGLSLISVDVGQKQLDLLSTLRPNLSSVAILVNPGNPANATILKSLQAAAAAKGIKIFAAPASTSEEIDRAFGAIARERADALVVAADAFFIGRFAQISQLSVKHGIPSIAPWREYVTAGGLMSYGQNLSEYYRRGAEYVDKILRGAKPADLPIEQPTNIHLAINRNTAKMLALSIPPELLLRADELVD
jgi:putative ABC transport system substrate-binding protein